jgi:SAM-dependent methyltransferase
VTANYDGAAARWATGATIVYGPIASELVRRCPHPLDGRLVLDVGAGTGAGSTALRSVGARPIALDLSFDMLRWEQDDRPPAVVAGVEQVPVAAAAIDDLYAAFVLNHITQPVDAMRALATTVRPGGAFLAAVFANEAASAVRDRIDDVARSFGWAPPDWYVTMKADAVPLLGTATAMRAAAVDAGLVDIVVDETAVDVGVSRPEQLVDYRFGQAHVSSWLDAMDQAAAATIREAAITAIAPIMVPYRPVVVFLAAITGG